MFPHIVDMIIDSAPREALFSLSRTSKDMWARTARLVPNHIRLCFAKFDHPNTEPDHTNPYRDRSNDIRVIAKRVMVKNAAPAVVETPAIPKLQPGDGWSFEDTRMVDIEGPIRSYFHPELFDALPAVHTLRFNSVPDWYIVPNEESVKRVVIRDYWRRDCSIHNFPRTTLRCPDGAQKVVCNIHYHVTSNMANFYLGRFSVRDVVIIFTNIDNVAGASSSHTDSTAPENDVETLVLRATRVKDDAVDAGSDWSINNQFGPLGWLRTVLPSRLHVTKYTLVNAALVPPICFGIPGPALSPAKLEIGIIHQMAMRFEAEHNGRRSWDVADWDMARKCIRVLPKSAYRKEIGEMDYRLETEW